MVMLVLAAWALVVTARLLAPSDMSTRDQERVAAYVLDITENGHWLAQEDTEGNFASKPPLFNWLSAAASLAHGGAYRIATSFPSWLATGMTALLILGFAARHFGRSAALWAAILYFASQLGLRQVLLLRTDALFQACVFAGLLFGFEAVERRRSWVPFWLAGAATTMTKGPLGIVLAAPWFVLIGREATVEGSRRRWREHLIGVGALLLIGGAWLLAANLATDGRAYDKLIADELVGHALGTKDDFGSPGSRFTRPTAWFLTRLAPMSLLAVIGFWRVFRRAAPARSERRLELGLTIHVLIGIAIFSMASENRFVHLLPLIPAAAILAGREAARLFTRFPPLAAVLLLGVGANLYLSVYDRGTTEVAHSDAIHTVAADLQPHFDSVTRLRQWDAPRGLFAHLGRFEQPLSIETLRDASSPIWIAVLDEAAFRTALDSAGRSLAPILERDLGRGETLRIWSDREALPPLLPERAFPWLSAGAFWAVILLLFTLAGRRVTRVLRSSAA